MQNALTVERAQRQLAGDVNPGDTVAFPLEDVGANGSGSTGGIVAEKGSGAFRTERAPIVDHLPLRTDGFAADENTRSFPIETRR